MNEFKTIGINLWYITVTNIVRQTSYKECYFSHCKNKKIIFKSAVKTCVINVQNHL